MARSIGHAVRHGGRRATAKRRNSTFWQRAAARARKWALLSAVLAVALVAGFLWLRDSPLFSVDSVAISGPTKSSRSKIEGALTSAAMGMSTLHVDYGKLDSVALQFAEVKEIRATPSLFHKLKIEVVMQRPVALVEVRGQGKVAVAADGTVLKGLDSARLDLPELKAVAGAGGVRGRNARACLTLLSQAPAALRPKLGRAYVSALGLTVELRGGLLIYFGIGSDSRKQWRVAQRLLADPSVKGASYIDVSSPERPAVGGVALEEPLLPRDTEAAPLDQQLTDPAQNEAQAPAVPQQPSYQEQQAPATGQAPAVEEAPVAPEQAPSTPPPANGGLQR